MVRTLIVAALAAAMAAVMAACGSASRPAPVRLQVFGDPLELAGYRNLIAAYQARHPGEAVELIPVGKQKDHMAKLATAFAAGDPPELFVLNFRRFGQFAAKGVLAPLGPAMVATGQWREQDFYEPAVEAFRFDGKQLCLPQNVSSLVVYYNRALFRSAGLTDPKPDWNLSDFVMAAINLRHRATDAQGQRVWGLGFEPTLIRVAPFIWAYDGNLVDDTVNPRQVALVEGRAMVALHLLKSLRSGGLVPSLAAYTAEDHEARFARGGMGMLLQSRRYTATLRQAAGLDWDVAPFPRGQKTVSALHADAYCQAATARDPAAAQRFVAFALSEEGQAVLTRSGRLVPSRKSVAQSAVFLDPAQPPASAQVFLDAISRLRRTPNVAAWHEIESKADVLLEEWFYESGAAAGDEEGEGLDDAAIITRQLHHMMQPLLTPRPAP